MNARSVLISSSGRRVELWRLFESAIRELGLPWRVIGADNDPSCATALAAGSVFQVPRIGDAGYSQEIRDLIGRERVALIVPTIDTELAYYASLQLPTVWVGASGSHTVALTQDKFATSLWANDRGLAFPPTSLLRDVVPSQHAEWVAKPRSGSSSVGVQLGLDSGRLTAFRNSLPVKALDRWLAQPCLHGPEFTINCFVDATGRCVYAVPHLRLATRSGEVSHAVTVRNAAVEDLTRRAIAALPDAFGPLCAQVIVDRDLGPVMIEINARFGGGYPVAHEAGARGPQRLLRQAAGLTSTDAADSWEPGVEMVRFDQSIFRRGVAIPISTASQLP